MLLVTPFSTSTRGLRTGDAHVQVAEDVHLVAGNKSVSKNVRSLPRREGPRFNVVEENSLAVASRHFKVAPHLEEFIFNRFVGNNCRFNNSPGNSRLKFSFEFPQIKQIPKNVLIR